MTALAQPATFDSIAASYDQVFSESLIGRAQRTAVWKQMERIFHSGDRVLDIGCGTGVDACFLAERGVRVLGCDCSEEMIRVARRQAGRKTSGGVEFRLLAAENIATLQGTQFEGAFSNFGALNCLQDLHSFARGLAPLIKPGGVLLICMLGPRCIWETMWFLTKGKPDAAFRRMRQNGVEARIADGPPLQVRYPNTAELVTAFSPEFRLASYQGVGLTVPPSYLEPWAARFPRLLSLAENIDSHLAAWPGLRNCADHMLLKFEREPL
jgi:ubiquinone/menaquinone biosynthesis C-methylase UbiE